MDSTSRLCDLITDNLLPYLEPKPARLSKENGKDVLLSLTRVCREIQLGTTNSSSKPYEALCQNQMDGSYNNHYCHQSMQKMVVGEHDCLCNIISATVAFLNADCQFVRHAVGNIILSISHFLIKFEYLWAKFLQLMWLSLEVLMSTIFSGPEFSASTINANESLMLQQSNIGDIPQDDTLQFARFIAMLKSRLLNLNLYVVVHLFQALRNILKSLKHESDDLEEIFMQYGVSSLMKIPWDSLIEIFGNCCYTNLISFMHVDQLDPRGSLIVMKNLLLGAILQLCCSLVKVYELEADGMRSELSVYLNLSNLVPKLLSCCFIDHLRNNSEFLSGYLRYKSLIMMTRLSLHRSWKIYDTESWLNFLQIFFGEILHQTISVCDGGSENCLEESPFLASNAEGDKSYARHLQRRAIFLFLKCSFTIASDESSKECACKEEMTSSCGPQICRKCCHLGSSETFAWLQRWFLLDKIQDCKNYSESCNIFATSFLQLYLEEDDLLFKMLLQLLYTPFSACQKESSNKNGSIGANKDLLCHFSSIFCPIRLFHLLLLLLHYDHLVLIDYLISKDTGVHCLQYLLRCLHVIQSSWPAFMQFSIFGNRSDRYNIKKRKITRNEDEDPTLLFSTEFGRHLMRNKYGQTAYNISDSQTFENVKGCLISLKRSIGELQQKNLFPYNPKPLLKSLTRFQELCI